MAQTPFTAALTIRPAIPEDADGITRAFLESAGHHATLDPARYAVPPPEAILQRYRNREQHSPGKVARNITLVAELGSEIVGFVDAGLDQSPDPMHRDVTYCHIAEIAVSTRHQNQGIGARLLGAVEQWGREQGAEFASLEYHAANTRAAEFYQERMGYSAAAIIAIKRL